MAFFEGLVETEDGAKVETAIIGGEDFYVIDDQGFRRHVEAAEIDRLVLGQFLEQMQEHRNEASQAMLRLMGSEDLFTKAMTASSAGRLAWTSDSNARRVILSASARVCAPEPVR